MKNVEMIIDKVCGIFVFHNADAAAFRLELTGYLNSIIMPETAELSETDEEKATRTREGSFVKEE